MKRNNSGLGAKSAGVPTHSFASRGEVGQSLFGSKISRTCPPDPHRWQLTQPNLVLIGSEVLGGLEVRNNGEGWGWADSVDNSPAGDLAAGPRDSSGNDHNNEPCGARYSRDHR